MASHTTASADPARRLFVAVTPPATVIAQLTDLLEPAKTRWPQIRWTIPSGWHFTCAFMGRVETVQYGRLADLLTELASLTARFGLGIAGAGAFPAPGLAKTLWLGADDPPGDLESVARGCRNAARRAGIQVADERFIGHLSVARFARSTDARPQIEALAGIALQPWAVTELVLVESLLGQGEGGRARYLIRERFPLSAY
ncbi:RNA 2',3'-cyclic phosphodiesterase [Brooklawnia sp.]|uniref:RNA 2',3'-cyclic phosphodiesterase n=1 Tax=Brooklawnia sp. TaxID=2699740 RepID=UPI0031200EEA